MKTPGGALCLGLTAALLNGCVAAPPAISPPLAPGPVELRGSDGPVYALAWAPDGKTLASAGYRQVNLWRLGSQLPPRTFTAHTDLVRGVDWSPDGSSIASVGDDGLVLLWNAETLVQSAILQSGPARAVKWSPDGRRLAIGSGFRMQIWDVARRALLHTARVQTQISSVAWSPDGDRVAVGGVNGMTTVWTQTGMLALKMASRDRERDDVNGVAWSPQGRLLATAHGAQGDGAIRLWNRTDATLAQVVPSPAGWLRGIGWSPDGQWLAAGGEDGQVHIWNVEVAKLVATFPTDSKPIWVVAWSPDGRRLAAGNTGSRTTGGTVSVWEAPVAVLPGREGATRARAVETALLARGRMVAPMASKPVPAATVFRDDGAYGSVTGIEPPFGNLETSFGESDLRTLGIAPGDRFNMHCRERTFALILGESVDEVAKGEWIGFVSLDGRLMIARYFASAAEGSGCRPGDTVVVSAGRRPDETASAASTGGD